MKRETTKIKEAMERNTNLFIKGKRTKTEYTRIDDKLHQRLFRYMKKKKK